MFEKVRKRIGHFIVRRKFLHKDGGQLSYNKIISNSKDFLLIMPMDDKDFYFSLEVIKYFHIHRKLITLFLPEQKYGLVPEKEKFKIISFIQQQLTRFYLPEKKLVQRLISKEYDVVIDLNRTENVFCSAVANIVKSKVRISFTKDFSEQYYNLQISDKQSNPEGSYRNFLNYLRMF